MVSDEKMFENVDIHTDIRMTEAYLYHKLTNEPNGSGELTSRCCILPFRQGESVGKFC